jgi:hypothetical protein
MLISLGDWFDNFHDSPKDSMRTAIFILELFEKFKDRFVWLLGNHDLPYIYPEAYDRLRCSGNTVDKLMAIQNIFREHLDRTKLRLMYKIKQGKCKDIALSHAGLSRYHFANKKKNISLAFADSLCAEALQSLAEMEDNPMIGVSSILEAGMGRGGPLPVGGITWQDWHREFRPFSNISQIVGHTPTHNPIIVDAAFNAIHPSEGALDTGLVYHIAPDVSYNINIDTHLNHFLTIENGKITIYKNE